MPTNPSTASQFKSTEIFSRPIHYYRKNPVNVSLTINYDENTYYLLRIIRWKNHWATTKHVYVDCCCMRWGPGSDVTCWIVWFDSSACCKHNLHHFCYIYSECLLIKTMKQVRQDRKQLLSFHGSQPCLLQDCLDWICDYSASANIICSFGNVGSIYWLN